MKNKVYDEPKIIVRIFNKDDILTGSPIEDELGVDAGDWWNIQNFKKVEK